MSVKAYERMETLPTLEQGPYNPHPVFPQWNEMDIYPNLFWGSMERHRRDRDYRMLYLENEYLKVACCVDLGGRLWSMYDKLAGCHAINYAPGVWSYNAGFGKNYTCGGLEINYPRAHAATTRLPREWQLRKDADGSATILISELERKYRTRWSYGFTLRPGQARLEMTVRLYNRTPFEARYLYWANCGFPINDTTHFIFPERAGAVHGAQQSTFSWPWWGGIDNRYPTRSPEALGLYMLDADEGYFGYYDQGRDVGLIHTADLADLPGKKNWTWGSKLYMGSYPHQHHPTGQDYGEIQSGRIVIQEHTCRMGPESEAQWTEFWYPVRGTGSFNGGGPGAVIAAHRVPGGKKRTVIDVKVMGTSKVPNARVLAHCPGHAEPVARKIALAPNAVAECRLELPMEVDGRQILTVRVVAPDGLVLGEAKIKPPETRDCWTEVPAGPIEPKAMGVEGIFRQAEALARDWYNRDARSKYEECLKWDPGYSPALGEIAKIDLACGRADDAIGSLQKALSRHEDSLEWRYYVGLAMQMKGEWEPAQRAYELACREQWEPRARVRLAEIRMQLGDFHHAVSHLTRVKEMAGRLTYPRGLMAAGLRRLGQTQSARRGIAEALAIDPMDPFLQIEQMRIAGNTRGQKALLTQVNHEEPPILEAAFDYGRAGLYEDALFALTLLENPGPLALFYRAWLEMKRGQAATAGKILKLACRLDPAGHYAWALELIPVLHWAIDQMPAEPSPCQHLGNLLMARHRTEEAVAWWRKAVERGGKSHLLHASLGYYHLHVAKDESAALACFRRAEELDPGDCYVKCEQAAIMNRQGKHRQVIRQILRQPGGLKCCPPLAHHLLAAYLAARQYRRFDEFVRGCDYRYVWQLPGPYTLWERRYLQEGLELLQKDCYDRALTALSKAGTVPHRAVCLPPEVTRVESPRVLYHQGRVHEKAGQIETAREVWRQAIDLPFSCAWEPALWYVTWSNRYYQALAHRKLGNSQQADLIFEAIEAVAKNMFRLPLAGRRHLMDLVVGARLSDETQWDPEEKQLVRVETSVEL